MRPYLPAVVAALLLAGPAGARGQCAPSPGGASSTTQRRVDSPELAEAERLNAQVLAFYKDRKFDKALPLAERVLSIREQALGPDHALVASALRNLSLILWEKGKHREAQSAYERFLTTYEKAVGSDTAKLGAAYDSYVCLLVMSGRKDEALEVQKRVYKFDNGFAYDESVNSPDKKLAGGGLMVGRLINSPAPVYPAEAKSARLSGSVVMKVTADETGRVLAVHTLCGHPLLAKGAEESIRRARYKPTLVAGKPAKVTGIAIYNFVLQ